MGIQTQLSDPEFVSNLRTAIELYLGALDRWEAAFQKYYRMSDRPEKISADMEDEQRDFERRRRELDALLPRARSLCLKHDLRNPIALLTRVSLDRFAPQQRTDSAIGRGERNAVSACLLELQEACIEWPPEAKPSRQAPKRSHRSLLGRVIDYFY